LDTLLYVTGCIAVIATIMVISRANAVHAVLYLIVSLLAVAIIFFILGAPFAAALEVIIYAGAIMVIFIFVIMMLNVNKETVAREKKWMAPAGWIGPAILSAVLLSEFIYIFAKSGTRQINAAVLGPKEVGMSLFGPYLLGVELASMLLLSGLIGAYYLGRRQRDDREEGGGGP
jgi:NADH-quinone oxidoreductase subunit J